MTSLEKLSLNKNQLLVLNLLAVIVYIVFAFVANANISEELAFYSHDSRCYRSVSNWIFESAESSHIEVRPYLYPLFLGITLKIGVWFLILSQALMWLVTVNLTFLSANIILNKKKLSWLPTLIVLLNFSLIGMSFHALTEVITTFLLSILIYITVKKKDKLLGFNFLYKLLFLLALLTIIRPVFYPILILATLAIIVLKFKPLIRRGLNILFLFLVISPVLLQLAIMYKNYNVFTVSNVGSNTFKYYFVAQIHQNVSHLTRKESIDLVSGTSPIEDKMFVFNHLKLSAHEFLFNVKNNINAVSYYSKDLLNNRNTFFSGLMKKINNLYLKIHVFFFPVVLVVFLVSLFYSRIDLPILIILSLISYGVILSSGLSFHQGDRLVLPVIAVWPILYLISAKKMFEILKRLKKRSNLFV